MRALGLNISGYISSAALVEDGRILGAACEERLSRIKRDRSFPERVTRWSLDAAGLKLDGLDSVAVAWNPAHNLARNFGMLSEANRMRGLYLAYVPNSLAAAFGLRADEVTEQAIFGRRIQYVDHHLAHAASTCFTSPFESGAVVTIDAFGENDTLTIGTFNGNNISLAERIQFPHSVGSFYSYLTEFLGFKPDSDEYKVMALGAFGDPEEGLALKKKLEKTYRLGIADGKLVFQLDLSLFDHYLFHRPRDFSALERHLGMPARKGGEQLKQQHFSLAWAQQACFEEMVMHILHHARTITGETRVALAGGCFMNSVVNGKLEQQGSPFDSVFIPPYPDDSGTAMGAALWATLQGRQGIQRFPYRHNFFGPYITPESAIQAVERRKLPYLLLDNPAAEIAARVAQGEIVGYAAGAMEFGQRALGHRSIFADPRDKQVKDRVNQHVKRREWFRPYAASVLAETISDIFGFDPGFEALFMEKVGIVRPEWEERIAGILHNDKSVRVHTIDEATNPRLHAVITEFNKITGVPLILNTSFNVDGMPIVASAEDALGCFYACGLDSLVLDNLLLTKSPTLQKVARP